MRRTGPVLGWGRKACDGATSGASWRGWVVAAVAGTLVLAGCTSPSGVRASGGASSSVSGGASGPTSSSPGATSPLASASTDPAKDPALARFYHQKLSWVPCQVPSGAAGFQCATLSVPVDYAKPTGATLGVRLDRLQASEASSRIGSLVLNPGGPGGSGVEYASYANAVVSPAVRARYDIVGFDPRGVGRSDPVRCLTDSETDTFLAADASPQTTAQVKAVVALSKLLGQRCQRRASTLLAHVGTLDVARDLDVLRAALGQTRLDYLGKSYGTFLGATYAGMFPWRVGRLVLDGALDPQLSSQQINLGQAGGFEIALNAFLSNCIQQSGCPLAGTLSQARTRLKSFLDGMANTNLPGSGGRELTQSLAVLGIVFAMYDQSFWPQLRVALGSALAGRGAGLLALADAYANRDPNGHYASNENDVIYAVNCLDRPTPEGPAQIQAQLPAFEKVSPIFGDYIAWSSLPCHYWPVPPEMTPHAVHAAGAAPILVVGTTRDPATPYAWAVSLAKELDSGVLLTYVGDGHTAYRRGSACIDNAVDAYLLTGKPPTNGTRCS